MRSPSAGSGIFESLELQDLRHRLPKSSASTLASVPGGACLEFRRFMMTYTVRDCMAIFIMVKFREAPAGNTRQLQQPGLYTQKHTGASTTYLSSFCTSTPLRMSTANNNLSKQVRVARKHLS